jgi:hypothetical protein
MTLYLHARGDCLRHKDDEALLIKSGGQLTPVHVLELRFAFKAVAGDVIPCECNPQVRVQQVYALIPGWSVPSAVSESEESSDDATPDPASDEDEEESRNNSDDADQPGPSSKKSKSAKAEKE